jgi:hypothetical protein
MQSVCESNFYSDVVHISTKQPQQQVEEKFAYFSRCILKKKCEKIHPNKEEGGSKEMSL